MTDRTLTPAEYRRKAHMAHRWARICMDSGQIDEARHQITEAARMFAAADEIEQERKIAA